VHVAINGWNFEGTFRPRAKCVGLRNGVVRLTSTWPTNSFRLRRCNILDCQACWLELGLTSVDEYLATKVHRFPEGPFPFPRVHRFPRGVREVILGGRLLGEPCPGTDDWNPAYPFLSDQGFRSLTPQFVNIDLHWSSWTPAMLRAFNPATLRKLKILVHRPSDCLKLEVALDRLPRLKALSLVDLPDINEFIDEYHHLGTGILDLRPSLRSLEISITNLNRPDEYRDREAFVEPRDLSFFFNALFPEPSTPQVAAHVRRMFEDPRTPVQTNLLMSNRGLLDLERLHLRHVGLPYWAFQTVLNPTTIKELHLPKCRIDPLVWDHLRSGKADTHALTDIRYDQLCKQFLDFVTTQKNLESLSFARPPDTYHMVDRTVDNWVTWFAVPEILQAAPESGPGTAWGRARWSGAQWNRFQYPTDSEFTNALRNKHHLKHLVLPIGMWDISPAFIGRLGTGLPGLGAKLPALESIEWGFDHARKVCLIFLIGETCSC